MNVDEVEPLADVPHFETEVKMEYDEITEEVVEPVAETNASPEILIVSNPPSTAAKTTPSTSKSCTKVIRLSKSAERFYA